MIYCDAQCNEEINEVEHFWVGEDGRLFSLRLQVPDADFQETFLMASD
jgi:hypothetical protein